MNYVSVQDTRTMHIKTYNRRGPLLPSNVEDNIGFVNRLRCHASRAFIHWTKKVDCSLSHRVQ